MSIIHLRFIAKEVGALQREFIRRVDDLSHYVGVLRDHFVDLQDDLASLRDDVAGKRRGDREGDGDGSCG